MPLSLFQKLKLLGTSPEDARHNAPPPPKEVERVYTIKICVFGDDNDHRRVRHNIAQHALALEVLAREIDPVGGGAFALYKDHSTGYRADIDIERVARTEDCTLAKTLNGMTFEHALRIVEALLRQNPHMIMHPGIMGWTKLNAAAIAQLNFSR